LAHYIELAYLLSFTMPKKFRDKIKHSAQSFRRNAPKEGRGGKGTWGNPLDDMKFVERPPKAALDKHDPNFVDNDRRDIDEWEEAVWLAEHEDFGDFFEEFENEPQQPTVTDAEELALKLETVIVDALNSIVREEKTPQEAYADIIPRGGHLENGGGTVITKQVIAMITVNEENYAPLADALNIFVNDLKIVTIRDIDHAFVDALSRPNLEKAIRLRDFAALLHDYQLFTEDKVHILTSFSEIDDQREYLRGVKEEIRNFVAEFYTSQDFEEVVRCIHALEYRFYQYEAVKILINGSMDRDNKARELASKLLGHIDVFDGLAVRRGLEILIERIDDLNKDVPDATGMLACFIARCISDEAIPPSFISEVSVQIGCATKTAIYGLQKVQHLLNMQMSAQRLTRVWGPGRGRNLDEIKDSMGGMIKEYLSNTDLNEIARSLVELAEPNFLHEFVKQAIIKGTDLGNTAPESIKELLILLLEKNIISPYQVSLGLRRLYTKLDNYKIDSPALPEVLERTKDALLPHLGEHIVAITANTASEI